MNNYTEERIRIMRALSYFEGGKSAQLRYWESECSKLMDQNVELKKKLLKNPRDSILDKVDFGEIVKLRKQKIKIDLDRLQEDKGVKS